MSAPFQGRRCVSLTTTLLLSLPFLNEGCSSRVSAQDFALTGVAVRDAQVRIQYPAEVPFVYALMRGASPTSIVERVSLQVGEASDPLSGLAELTDPAPLPTEAFYRVERRSVLEPLDSDADGYLDTHELWVASDPLDPQATPVPMTTASRWVEVILPHPWVPNAASEIPGVFVGQRPVQAVLPQVPADPDGTLLGVWAGVPEVTIEWAESEPP